MHLTQMGYEQQMQLVGPDGTVVWYGTVIFGQASRFASTESSTTIAAGGAIIVDGPNTTFGRDANLATNDPDILLVSGVQVVSAASVGFLGVATESVAPAVTGQPGTGTGTYAGTGSMLSVRVTSGAIAVGSLIGGSATTGLCASIARTTAGTILGICLKAAAQIGTSGLYSAGLLVAQE